MLFFCKQKTAYEMRISDWSSDVCSSDLFGIWPPLLAILAMCAGTVTGYVFGPALGAALGATGWAWFQALVAGTILHVVFGRPHIDPDAHHQAAPHLEGLGNLCALAGLIALARLDHETLPAAGDRKSTRLNSSH